MSVIAIANRYAESLYSVVEESELTQTLSCLSAVKDLYGIEDASKILSSPVMPKQLKLDLLNYALDQSEATKTVRSFFEVVVDSGRVELIPAIFTGFSKLVEEAKGISSAEVVSATALSAAQLEQIKTVAEKKFGAKLELSSKLDEDLLGGFMINVGNKRIDLSLKSKLEALTASAAQ